MKKMKRVFAALLAAFAVTTAAHAQQQQQAQKATPVSARAAVTRADGSVDVERIIRAFTAKEAEFARALSQYGFKREAIVQTIGMGGQITGEYKRVSRFVLSDNAERFERILHFPMPTIQEVTITAADIEDLGGVQAFALEPTKIDRYSFTYVGKERIDELDLYMFDVAPKVMPDPKKTKERLFQGRIWVDDQDLQIVKARGKGVPEGDERFPVFETYREQIDGRYWFPTYAYADDELVFKNGGVVHLRVRIKYTDYEKLGAKVTIIEEGEPGVEDPEKNKPAPPNKPPQQ
jgi:muconolactone delta-isomerase